MTGSGLKYAFLWLSFAVSGLILSGSEAMAAEHSVSARANTPHAHAFGDLLRVSLSLIVVLGLILAAGWFLTRVQRGARGAHRALRCLDTLSIGTRERIVLLEAGETQIIVGVAPGRVETLHVLEKPVVVTGEKTPANQTFAGLLRNVAGRRRA